MKEKFLLMILLLGVLSVVSADESEISATFNVGGCSIPDSTLGLAKGYCSVGGAFDGTAFYGQYYCYDDGTSSPQLLLTSETNIGCSKGVPYDTFSGNDYCCPLGYYCADDSYGYTCVPMEELCSENDDDESGCDALGYCTWLNNTGKCVQYVIDEGCEYYTTEEQCEDDELNISVYGVGSEKVGDYIECVGTIFTVSKNDSKCTWNGTGCHFNYTVEKAYDEDGIDVPTFSCTSVYSLSECVDGEQTVDWSSSYNATLEDGGLLTDENLLECLIAVGCSSGETTRFCGEASVKLPGVSFLSLVLSFVFITGFYFVFTRKL